MSLRSALGTSLYYLVAVFLGVVLLATAFHLHARSRQAVAEDEPLHLIISLAPALLSIVPQWISAFLLRRLARAFGWKRAWQWMLAGSVLTLVVLWLCGEAGLALESRHFAPQYQPLKAVLIFLLVGAMMLGTKPFWLPLPGAALLALVLFLIERKFAPKAAPPVTSGS